MSKDTLNVSGVTYTTAEAGYFEKRKLRRSAGIWGLWGLAVAAVISGDFSGWNFGIDFAGFGGMLIAFALLIVMYYGMIFAIGEMASAMPHTGGAYSFARAALGPWGGFVTGLAETIEYVATTAVIVYFSASYADGITSELLGVSLPAWAWWAILYAVFIGLNSAGAAISFKFAIVVSIISIGILLVFSAMAAFSGLFSVDNLFDIAPEAGQSEFLPFGVVPILFALPYAMWFFLGIEELPLAAEESHDPVRDIPRAGLIARTTLIVTGLLVLVLNTGIVGASNIATAGEPLLDGFRAMVGDEAAAVLALFALVGLLASLQGIMFAYGRNMYSLSRAGYYPKFLSLTGRRQTPAVALLVGALIGFVALILVDSLGGAGGVAGAIVLNIAVWGAVIAYILQMISFVVLRRKYPNANRPYRSPWGVPGAVIAGILSLAIFFGFFINEPARPAIAAIAVVYVVMLLIFALYGRKRLVLSPEEEYAVSGGLHGDPQKEGYGGAVEEQLLALDGRDDQRAP
ncbi:amino acid permease [Cryobacterium sp. TMT1-62]|uniref:Amino acid permease n=1 Tax=Cryobacterium sandaracinum TaxID=1259247 RepID=A0ABY2J9Q7_9MICO|nr:MULTISPECIES: amino acid permease [Cryobacterium]TFB54580.1 amino acid permease [Cryobacterium sp. Sr3]TFB65592.1 amino acid permease [Cryobacterium sp. Hz7]TFC33661.1 amino acid permease [Cryobacterium sp. TMT2-14]TFC47704.1 amino acid permease [Cryobacterium sp. TMT2-17-1]TFC63422.1 amino acid permease [Cryobacterium sp. TMT2-15-1]